MKKEDIILIIHIILQIILFVPVATLIKYYQKLDWGVLIVILLSIINFITFIISVLNSEKKFILKHSTLVILFILFVFLEDLVLRFTPIGKHIELMIYTLLMLSNFELICPSSKIKPIKIITEVVILISIFTVNFNYLFSNTLLNCAIIILLFSPVILYILDKNIRKYDEKIILLLQSYFAITFLIYKIYFNRGLLSISEYQLLTIIFMEFILLHKIMSTDIKNGLIFFGRTLKNLFPGFFVLVLILFLLGIPFSSILLLSFFFFIFLSELKSYEKYRRYQFITFDEMLDNYYIGKYKTSEVERLSTLKIQTFLHDDILQIIIAIRRWIEDNLSGSGKDYILENLDKVNNLIRHEINSFNPMLKDYNSLYEAYNRLIEELEEMYLNRQMLIEFECDKNIKLPSPYDELIYKCINELLINAFKHSKGYSTDIVLKITNKIIYLTITNFGDYIENRDKIKKGNIGLNILRLNLKEYRGLFEFEISSDKDELDDSYIKFKIEIPIDRSVVNENLVNRRS